MNSIPTYTKYKDYIHINSATSYNNNFRPNGNIIFMQSHTS